MLTLRTLATGALFVTAMTLAPPLTAAIDPDSARALAKKSECFKCHAIDKQKTGPPFREVSKKYKGKVDAEDKLIKHVTTKPMVEVDGKKEEHPAVKTGDPDQVRNLVQWILSY